MSNINELNEPLIILEVPQSALEPLVELAVLMDVQTQVTNIVQATQMADRAFALIQKISDRKTGLAAHLPLTLWAE